MTTLGASLVESEGSGMDWHERVTGGLPDGAEVLDSEVLVLQPEAVNVRQARRWVAERLPDWLGDDADTVLLLTSELVTNVVMHARTELEVGIAVTRTDVLIGVHDLDLGRSEIVGSERREGGRGLTLVEALSAACGVVQHPGGGKTAWFRMSA